MCFQGKPPPKLEHIHSNPTCQEAYICHTCWVASVSRQRGEGKQLHVANQFISNSMCAINLLVMNGRCSGRSHSAFVTGVQYWPKGRWTACARATLYVRLRQRDKEADSLNSDFQFSILAKTSFHEAGRIAFPPIITVGTDGKGHFTRAPQNSCWHLLSIFNMNYKLEAPAMIEFALCANIPC